MRLSTYTEGTVSDPNTNASGISQVWVAISSGLLQNIWWNDGARAFNVSQSSIFWSTQVYLSGNTWSYKPAEWSGSGFQDGVFYTIFVHAKDHAGNTVNYAANMVPLDSTPGQTQTLRYDVTRPTASVSFPINSLTTGTLTQLSGVATDPGAGFSGIKAVYVAVEHVAGADGLIGWYNWGNGQFNVPTPEPISQAPGFGVDDQRDQCFVRGLVHPVPANLRMKQTLPSRRGDRWASSKRPRNC